jgi:hypothetical protein
MKNILLRLAAGFVTLLISISVSAQAARGPVYFQPGREMQSRYQSPGPAKGATNSTRKAVIGSGKTAIDTGDPKNAFWTESVDLDGTGLVSNADMLWDASSKILYVFSKTTLRCTHGKAIDGAILIAIYGKKNFLSKPPGSGWWMVDLEQGQCQAPLASLYGCKFGTDGQSLACGRAEIDPRINDVAIVESSRF